MQDNVRYHGRRGKITSFGLAFLCVLFLCVKTAVVENDSSSNILVTGYCREQERMDFIMYNRFEVGERLTQVREEHGHSQEGLAEKVGCSVITISRWENGHTQMKGEDISKVCMVLGISADYLLGLPVKTDLGLLEGLNESEINIVMQSMRAMVAALKSNRSAK